MIGNRRLAEKTLLVISLANTLTSCKWSISFYHFKEWHMGPSTRLNVPPCTRMYSKLIISPSFKTWYSCLLDAGIIVIIVICVGFLMFMIVLGVIRIRAAHNRNNVVKVEENPEMEWDNSALNIIVNPMDDAGVSDWK